jgi:hypothetical protein
LLGTTRDVAQVKMTSIFIRVNEQLGLLVDPDGVALILAQSLLA